ncbi:MAG: hypothetical protein CSA61_00005, partial [Neptuniibacter caesariensis]
ATGWVPVLELSPLSDLTFANMPNLSARGWPRYRVGASVGAQPPERFNLRKNTKSIGQRLASLQGGSQCWSSAL